MIDPIYVSSDFAAPLFAEIEDSFNSKVEHLLSICSSFSDTQWLISLFKKNFDKYIEKRSSIYGIGFQFRNEIGNWSGNVWMGNCRFEVATSPFDSEAYEGHDDYMEQQGYDSNDCNGYIITNEASTPAIYMELPDASAFADHVKWLIEHSYWYEGFDNSEMTASLGTVVNEYIDFVDNICQSALFAISREVQEHYNQV